MGLVGEWENGRKGAREGCEKKVVGDGPTARLSVAYIPYLSLHGRELGMVFCK